MAQEDLGGNNRELFAKGRTGGNRGKAQTVNPQNKDEAPNAHMGW